MRLAAIYNVWDGVELLKGSIDQIKDHVDLFIIVWQDTSNFGEKWSPMPRMIEDGLLDMGKMIFYKYSPSIISGHINEKNKRQIGINIAKENNCTHFLHLDCDEYYDYEEFKKAKSEIILNNIEGSVCKIFTYFKSPSLRLETPDGYHVPFIHKLKQNSSIVKKYPFYVDPTRRINETNVIELRLFMHHFSWVRENINRKINNSSARENIKRGNLYKYFESRNSEIVKPGVYIKDFGKRLILVENKFNVKI